MLVLLWGSHCTRRAPSAVQTVVGQQRAAAWPSSRSQISVSTFSRGRVFHCVLQRPTPLIAAPVPLSFTASSGSGELHCNLAPYHVRNTESLAFQEGIPESHGERSRGLVARSSAYRHTVCTATILLKQRMVIQMQVGLIREVRFERHSKKQRQGRINYGTRQDSISHSIQNRRNRIQC